MYVLPFSGELAYHGHRVKIFDSSKDALNKVFSRLKEDRHMLQKDGLLAQENFLVHSFLLHACMCMCVCVCYSLGGDDIIV